MSKEIPIFDEGPNPFRLLGLTPEAVKLLDEPSLRLALRGLFRAWSTQLHPDAHPDLRPAQQKTAQERFSAVQAAYTKLDSSDGLEAYRKDYVGVKKSKKDQTIQELTEHIRAVQENNEGLRYRIRQLLGEFLDPENIHNIDEADLLVQDIMRRKMEFGVKGQALSETSFGLSIIQGDLYTQKTAFKRKLDDDLEELFPDEETDWGFSNGMSFIIRTAGAWTEREDVNKPKGWYRLMGKPGNRTALRYEVTSDLKPFEAKLVGSMPAESISRIVGRRKSLHEPQKRFEAFRLPGDPLDKPNEHIYSSSIFIKLISEDEFIQIIDSVKPKLIEGNMIIAELSDGRYIILGQAFATHISKKA